MIAARCSSLACMYRQSEACNTTTCTLQSGMLCAAWYAAHAPQARLQTAGITFISVLCTRANGCQPNLRRHDAVRAALCLKMHACFIASGKCCCCTGTCRPQCHCISRCRSAFPFDCHIKLYEAPCSAPSGSICMRHPEAQAHAAHRCVLR